MGNRPIARHLSTQSAQHKNAYIHASNGIQTHDPSVREVLDHDILLLLLLLLLFHHSEAFKLAGYDENGRNLPKNNSTHFV